MMQKKDIRSMTPKELETFVVDELKDKKFRAKQIYDWMHVKLVQSFDEMSNLSKDLRSKLQETATLCPLEIVDCLISEIDGTVQKIEDVNGRFKIYVKNEKEVREHLTMYGAKLKVEKGSTVNAGDQLTEGSVSPKELLAVTDPNTVQQYILKEVQKVYRSQGVDINDKHVELIAKRMISLIRVVDAGDTSFVPSTVVSISEFTNGNRDVIFQGKTPAIGQPILLGITKAALQTDSFLSSASFQETTRILTEAAVKGATDKLHGLKENVIIGKLIPAGTGAKEYMDIGYSLEQEFYDEEPSEVLEDEFME